MATKKLWNVRIEKQLIERLARLGERLGYPSGNAFAADALDIYAETLADFILELREDRRATIKRQHDRYLDKGDQAELLGKTPAPASTKERRARKIA